jgi:hypothetical protein
VQTYYWAVTRNRALVIGTLAWSGVVVGHLVAYQLTYFAQAERLTRLAETGHGSFSLLLVSAIASIPAILSLLTVRAVRGDQSPPLLSMTVWLAGIQVSSFMAMELIERGMSLDHFLLEPAILVGLVVQVLVAVTSALLVRVFFRLVVALSGRLTDHPERPLHDGRLAPVPDDRPARFDFLIGAPHRAPPLSLAP